MEEARPRPVLSDRVTPMTTDIPASFGDPRMRGFRSRRSVEDAQGLIDGRVGALGTEWIGLADAFGRVLAQDAIASVSVPAFDRAAMDGYAVQGEMTFGADSYNPVSFRIVGRSRPGRPFAGTVGPGDAVEIATGAPVPAGTDAVVKVESTRTEGATVLIVEPTPPGRNLGRLGEDVSSGSKVLDAGRTLRPQDLGVLSGLGSAMVLVIARPRVAILITGDELLPPGSVAHDAFLPDMNSVMLAACVARDGGIARVVGPIPDCREEIVGALAVAVSNSDVVLVSGGSSTGPEDHAPSIVAELGELSIHGVAIRPASPAGIGFVAGIPVALLPGNPVSCLCAYDFFGGRMVRRLAGRSPEWSYRSLDVALGEKLVSDLGRVDYTRVKVAPGGVFPLATSGASILSGTSRADGFVVVPAGKEGYPAGEVVRVWLYD